MRVLIVDDTSIIRIVLKDMLQEHEISDKRNIFEAAGGREAIQRYKDLQPDVVLLDINMNDLDGITVVREIKKKDEKAKIIMCTASGDIKTVHECIRVGAVGYLVKPIDPPKLIKAIEKVKALERMETIERVKALKK